MAPAEQAGEPALALPDVSMPDSAEFFMFVYKILPCARREAHAWSDCPFAHPGEKARRRNLRKHHYSSELCPVIARGDSCKAGAACTFAHNTFEVHLHPERFRTMLCKDRGHCKRAVCFFAHSTQELRVPSWTPWGAGLVEAPAVAPTPALPSIDRAPTAWQQGPPASRVEVVAAPPPPSHAAAAGGALCGPTDLAVCSSSTASMAQLRLSADSALELHGCAGVAERSSSVGSSIGSGSSASAAPLLELPGMGAAVVSATTTRPPAAVPAMLPQHQLAGACFGGAQLGGQGGVAALVPAQALQFVLPQPVYWAQQPQHLLLVSSGGAVLQPSPWSAVAMPQHEPALAGTQLVAAAAAELSNGTQQFVYLPQQ